MEVASFPPSPRLRPYVQAIRAIVADAESQTGPLPEPGLVMAVRYAGRADLMDDGARFRIPDASLSGIRPSLRRIHTTSGGGLVVAFFGTAGAPPFSPPPWHELFGTAADLGDAPRRTDVDRLQSQ